jgi:hypothetical protein
MVSKSALTCNSSEEEVKQRFGADALEEYYAIGRSIYKAIMNGLNRLIGYTRPQKASTGSRMF